MKRVYTEIINHHLGKYRQMIFLSGPRQVGKTTCSKLIKKNFPNFHYINWENNSHRKLIVQGADAVAEHLNLDKITKQKPIVVFDEIHKYRKWKYFIKGFFDVYEEHCQIVVTGSSKLNVYIRGGDSLMGRYFPYHLHPLSIGELAQPVTREKEILPPKKIPDSKLEKLFDYGGFPEPFVNADKRFYNNWQRLRKQQLIQEDIRALSQIQDFAELEVLMDLLISESGNLLNTSSLSNQLNVAATTVQRWIKTLESFYYSFSIQPWSKNVRRSLRKTPKVYLWDWSIISNKGQKVENFVASHLFKSIQFWTDMGHGDYQLYFLRDKNKREVDFLVTKNKEPWFLVEVKYSQSQPLSPSLQYYHKELKTKHAFQVAFDLPYENRDCFELNRPIIVPATTFLSQLV